MGFLEQALKLNPNYAAAHSSLAWCLETRFVREGFAAADMVEGVRHARLALTYGSDDPTALSHAALVILHLDHDFATASSAIERALTLNNSCATALYTGAHIHAFSGDPAIAEDYANRASRLSPFDPQLFHKYEALGFVRLRARRYDEAAAFFAQAVHLSRDDYSNQLDSNQRGRDPHRRSRVRTASQWWQETFYAARAGAMLCAAQRATG